jgi:hypothetical protein
MKQGLKGLHVVVIFSRQKRGGRKDSVNKVEKLAINNQRSKGNTKVMGYNTGQHRYYYLYQPYTMGLIRIGIDE